jgi:hypothetical protein
VVFDFSVRVSLLAAHPMIMRVIWVLCLVVVLLAALAVPGHTHKANDNSHCLICHVGPAANTVGSAAANVVHA